MLISVLFVVSHNIVEVFGVVMIAPQNTHRNYIHYSETGHLSKKSILFNETIFPHPYRITSPITCVPKYQFYEGNSTTKWSHAWKYESENVTVLAYQGDEESMEDRFVIDENIDNTGISLYALFDGYDGNFTADYLAYIMTDKLRNKIIDIKKSNFKQKLDSYLFPNGSINYTKLLNDEIVTAEKELRNKISSEYCQHNLGASTVLIAIIEGNDLHIAHVCDSRAIMCDLEGKATRLTEKHHFEENPKEQKRVLDARESTDHPYVWHGMSRIIGDVDYKRRNKHVIPNPEVFSYDLSKCKCKFLILGTDGVFEHFCHEDLDEQMIITHLNENLDNNLLQAMTNVLLRFKELRYDGDNKTLMVIKITQ